MGEELYDYQTDPAELRDLTKQAGFSSLKADLRARLLTIIAARKG
jgi:hypothetical protein